MKIKISLLAILLLATVLFASCTNTPQLPQNTQPPNEESRIETQTETQIETQIEMPTDPFESIRSSGEEWLFYGLKAYENGYEPKDLKEFFAVSSNLTYLTLFDHFFTYDKEKSVPVAEALFRFIVDHYGVEALLDMEKRIDYKNEFLKSLGLNTSYTQTPAAELLLASMDFSSNDQYQYILSFDKVTYYFKDFRAGSPSQYHGFLYFNTVGLYEMIAYLTENGLDEGLDTYREFHFYMTFDGSGYSKTVYPSGNMYINDHASALHEAVHAMGIRRNDHIWLSEGICNYFGKSLGFNDQIAASYIQILEMAKQGYFNESANAGDPSAILYKMIYENYTNCGGKSDSVDTFDLPLYMDVVAKIELDTGIYTTLGDAYKIVNKTECIAVGKDLSYEQATSLVIYLAETYGVEKVLEAYHLQNIETVFEKDYESLRADWLEHLTKRFP